MKKSKSGGLFSTIQPHNSNINTNTQARDLAQLSTQIQNYLVQEHNILSPAQHNKQIKLQTKVKIESHQTQNSTNDDVNTNQGNHQQQLKDQLQSPKNQQNIQSKGNIKEIDESLHLPQIQQNQVCAQNSTNLSNFKTSLGNVEYLTERRNSKQQSQNLPNQQYQASNFSLYKTVDTLAHHYESTSTMLPGQSQELQSDVLSKLIKNPFHNTSKHLIGKKRGKSKLYTNRTNLTITDAYQSQDLPLSQSTLITSPSKQTHIDLPTQQNKQNQTNSLTHPQPQTSQILFDPVTSQLDTRVNLKVMEIWLNETMQTAEAQSNENLGLTSDILKIEQKKPLNRFNVDRMTLFRAGISQDQIDRIYRSLFVYSVGFYEMLKSAIGQCKNRPALISNFWKVYSILLEYCCKHDYRMQIQEITEKHTEEMKTLEVQIQERQVEFLEKEGMLKQNIQNLLNKLEEIEKERQLELLRRQQLQKDHEQQNKNYEDEINLRKRYEMKINELFILHREVETRYKRAVEEIIRIDFMKDEANQQLSISKADLDLIKKSAYQTEVKLQKSKQEEEYWRQQAEILKEKELYREDLITKIKTEMRFAQKQINELGKTNLVLTNDLTSVREKNEQLQSTISTQQITIDNERTLKESFQELSQKLQKDLDFQIEQHSHCTAKIIALQILNKHMSKTLEEQKVEIDMKTQRLDYLEQEYFSTTNKKQEYEELYTNLKKDHELAVQRLSETQKEKAKYEQVHYAEQVKNRELQSFIEDKDRIMDKYKKDGEKIAHRLNQLEIAYDNLEIIKQAAAQKSTLEFEELRNRTMSLEVMLANAKSNRHDLLLKIEEEQKSHNETVQEMNKLKLQLEDKYIENQKLQATLENEMKKDGRWKRQVEELYEKINVYVQRKEILEKDLNTAREMLNVTETTSKAYFKKANQDYIELKRQMDLRREQYDMRYEDLLSTSRELMHIIDDQKIKSHTDQTNLRISKTMLAKMEQEIYDLRFAQETLEKEVKNNSTVIDEYQVQTSELSDWNKTLESKLQKTKLKKKAEQDRYWDESKKRLAEIRELKEKVQELEDGKKGVDQEIQVQIYVPSKSVNIQTDIANDNRIMRNGRESTKNLLAVNSVNGKSNSHRNDSAADDKSSLQELSSYNHLQEPQIYKKQTKQTQQISNKQSTYTIDEDFSEINNPSISNNRGSTVDIRNNDQQQNNAQHGYTHHYKGKMELQLPKIGLKQGGGKHRQFKTIHQRNKYLTNDDQDEYGFSKISGSQTDRRHPHTNQSNDNNSNHNLQKPQFQDTSTSPTGLRKTEGMTDESELILLKKSVSNQELIKNGGVYGISQENMLLLKNAPRPPKGSQYDKETQKMIMGKCSLKELLKSAATRPQ